MAQETQEVDMTMPRDGMSYQEALTIALAVLGGDESSAMSVAKNWTRQEEKTQVDVIKATRTEGWDD